MQEIEILSSGIAGFILQVVQEKIQGDIPKNQKVLLSIALNITSAVALFALFNYNQDITYTALFESTRNFAIGYTVNQAKHYLKK